MSTGHSKQGKSVRSGSPSTAELVTGFTFTGLKKAGKCLLVLKQSDFSASMDMELNHELNHLSVKTTEHWVPRRGSGKTDTGQGAALQQRFHRLRVRFLLMGTVMLPTFLFQ